MAEIDSGITQPASVPASIAELWSLAREHAHKEIWGVTLADPATHIPTYVILQKYLNANDQQVEPAKEQLRKTLDYRAQVEPTKLVDKVYSKEKFKGLGYVTSYSNTTAATPTADEVEVFTWNLYGGPDLDISKSFGDLDAFIEWRVALMELAMHKLNLATATKKITAEDDPYKIYQVHDYAGTSFFRAPPEARAAAKKTIEVLSMAYPETLKEKFFVNVPAIMGFMYGIMKAFVAVKTVRRFHPMSNGARLAHEFSSSSVTGLGPKLPKQYGGEGIGLAEAGKQTKFE